MLVVCKIVLLWDLVVVVQRKVAGSDQVLRSTQEVAGMGLMGLAAFFWSMKDGQYDDMDGAANRILIDDEDEPA